MSSYVRVFVSRQENPEKILSRDIINKNLMPNLRTLPCSGRISLTGSLKRARCIGIATTNGWTKPHYDDQVLKANKKILAKVKNLSRTIMMSMIGIHNVGFVAVIQDTGKNINEP